MGISRLGVHKISNVIGPHHLRLIQESMSGAYFGWYFHPDINYGHDNNDSSKIGFVHTFIRDDTYHSDYAPLIAPIVWSAIDATQESFVKIVRVKANMTLNNGCDFQSIHQDIEPNCLPSWNMWSAIYYPFDVDGDTVFYADDKVTEIERITPTANTMVLFNSNVYHSASSPKIATNRKIINAVFATVSHDNE